MVEAILLSVDRRSQKSQTLADMFTSFYSSLILVAHDVTALERGFWSYTDIHQGLSNKTKVAIAEKNAILECLQATANQEREEKEREKEQAKEISQLKAELELARADLGSTTSKLELAHSKLELAQNEIFEGGQVSYWTGYEDGRDAVGKLYPNLDLSHIIMREFDDESNEADDAPIEKAPIEEVPVKEALATIEFATMDLPPTSDDLASALAIVDSAVDDADRRSA
ncbi:hypothetical protein COCNU_03G002460 [Cocos nucifera]|uniref:Uncharacterized protein n=1 Tax=Cocos nucifera TaxID=13894 RepID=A0A8K0I1H9_COCNU|nr:hypothetical protein COCNU_03G002460 [Cocos nucifera]